MSKPENGRRRKADPEAEATQPLTIKLPLGLFDRAEDYKNELRKQARQPGGQKAPTWTEIISAALEDYLKKKGA